jgi:hypothetical protein
VKIKMVAENDFEKGFNNALSFIEKQLKLIRDLPNIKGKVQAMDYLQKKINKEFF